MTAEFGVFFLIMSLLVSLLQSSYLVPSANMRLLIGRVMPSLSWLSAAGIALSMVVLITLRLDSDFSVVNVIEHSNLSLPVLYKIAGTWGNHEGSMLLWVLVLSLFGALLAGSLSGSRYSELGNNAVAVQSVLCAGFLAFILDTSNPFKRVFPPLVDGKALNSLLQDMGLVMHPPLLYLGYVGFSIVFSLAVAALLQGKADKDWAQIAHPWILLSWSSLTLGIGLGSWWAYRELGWGGWWFWDPVENASLLPWLAGTALLHSNIVLKKRGLLPQWVILLSIITFALSLLGTFLVRSGAITSVHSFASDPARGVFILAYIFISVGGALFLYAVRGGKIESHGYMRQLSREGFILINNLFILSACATVLLGTLYPMFAEISGGDKITVGAPFFEATFIPIMAISLFFAAFTPFIAWKKASVISAANAARPALMAVFVAVLLVLAFVRRDLAAAICGIGLATWIAAGSLWWLIKAKGKHGKYPVFFGHIGAAFMVFAITTSGLWKEEVQNTLKIGDSISIAGYNLTYKNISDLDGGNYQAKQASLLVMDKNNKPITTLQPEYRKYNITESATSEADIYYSISGDLYAVIGETMADGKTAIRIYFQPMINLLWLGFVLMAVGGIMGFFSRKTIEHLKTHTERN